MHFQGVVVVESPFAPPKGVKDKAIQTAYIERNQRYARAAMRWCLKQGYAPFASHLLYTQPGVLDDFIPDERTLGIEAGLFLSEACATHSFFFLDYGMSKGMERGKERALAAGRTIKEVRLGEAWEHEWLGDTAKG
jgi:hypothetical protein